MLIKRRMINRVAGQRGRNTDIDVILLSIVHCLSARFTGDIIGKERRGAELSFLDSQLAEFLMSKRGRFISGADYLMDGGTTALTPAGMFVSNSILSDILDFDTLGHFKFS